MKFLLLMAGLSITLVSCKKTPLERVNKSDLKTYFLARLHESDSTATLEAFDVTRLDTVSNASEFQYLFNLIGIQKKMSTNQLEYLLGSVRRHRQMQNLASDISETLYDTYKSNADEDMIKLKEAFSNDTLLLVDMKRVSALMAKADTVKPVAYVVFCPYTIKKKDMSVSKDTMSIDLDLDYNILNQAESNKRLKALYKPVSNFKIE